MIELTTPKDAVRLRRLALSSQGLTQSHSFGRGVAGARKAIAHLGYVQIDTISVVERAHLHVLHSRVPTFEPAMLDQLLVGGDVFEYWSHAAAFYPSKIIVFLCLTSRPLKVAKPTGIKIQTAH
ncbi:winged helix DNA-binding domain-containing protein [Marinomonas pontica]|uniref:DNA glycosylase AlkZ-like family protein n=1 Tax=Marinomonas pontica TaxID=264739 RepID=UPI0022445905|nr:crosslink repair DNA glycosylase YcaQ family protein [Marinomonas pontica]MCW8354511.1 winged helix DNA-binding domain-containing protein [Marinomonas pontica]